jgi:hypothetical protein
VAKRKGRGIRGGTSVLRLGGPGRSYPLEVRLKVVRAVVAARRGGCVPDVADDDRDVGPELQGGRG